MKALKDLTLFQSRAQLQMLRNEDFADEDLLQGVQDRIDRVLGVLAAHQERAGAIAASTKLTQEGKQDALAKLKRQTKELLSVERSRGKDYENQIASLEKAMSEKRAPAEDPVLRFLREMEVRALYRGMDPLELRVAYEQAVRDGENPVFQTALENAPVPLLPAGAILAGKQRRADRLDPETAAKLENLRTVQGVFQDAVASAHAELEIPADGDPLVAAAAGGAE